MIPGRWGTGDPCSVTVGVGAAGEDAAMIDKQFLVERDGRTFALYAGLLDAAHRAGLRRITTSVVQAGAAANGETWVVAAEVETERGTFGGIGDASPANVPPDLQAALPRLAETRAKARALRDALNAGALVALEELGSLAAGETLPPSPPSPRPVPGDTPASERRPPAPSEEGATPAQLTAIERLSRERALSGAELDQAYQSAGARVGQPLSKRQASLVIRALQAHPTR
jgi:hypothetical protein